MKNKRFLVLSLFVILSDQLSKWWIMQQLQLGDRISVMPFFNLVHVRNYGAAFNFLNIPGGLQRWVFVGLSLIIAFVLLLWLHRTRARWQSVAIALILGGALGNLQGRLYRGYVVDFLDAHWNVYHWPAFNIADTAVCVGVILLLLQLIFTSTLRDKQ